ncbi:MAG: hypothetical protein FRX49_02081 [Trebouxia sp. A1-2]|nr:MAG: hypothetical protein FRX49_02081 [Trebouxia sp. A1-2]
MAGWIDEWIDGWMDERGAPYLTNIFNDELFGLNVLFGKQAPSVHPTAPKPQVLGPPLHVLRGAGTIVNWLAYLLGGQSSSVHNQRKTLTVQIVELVLVMVMVLAALELSCLGRRMHDVNVRRGPSATATASSGSSCLVWGAVHYVNFRILPSCGRVRSHLLREPYRIKTSEANCMHAASDKQEWACMRMSADMVVLHDKSFLRKQLDRSDVSFMWNKISRLDSDQWAAVVTSKSKFMLCSAARQLLSGESKHSKIIARRELGQPQLQQQLHEEV